MVYEPVGIAQENDHRLLVGGPAIAATVGNPITV